MAKKVSKPTVPSVDGADADWTVKEKLSRKGAKAFQLTVNQELRCGTVDHPELQEAWEANWQARLEILKAVFPWIIKSIEDISGKSAATDPAGFLEAYADYNRGKEAENEKLAELHYRQNAAWTELTGLPPLGNQDAWRAAGHASMAPTDIIEHCDIEALVGFIKPWAIAARAEQLRRKSEASPNGLVGDLAAAVEAYGRLGRKAAVEQYLGKTGAPKKDQDRVSSAIRRELEKTKKRLEKDSAGKSKGEA